MTINNYQFSPNRTHRYFTKWSIKRAIISIQSQCFSSKQFHSKRSYYRRLIVEFRSKVPWKRDAESVGRLESRGICDFHARPDDASQRSSKVVGSSWTKSKYRHEKKCSFAKAGEESSYLPTTFTRSSNRRVAMLFWKMHECRIVCTTCVSVTSKEEKMMREKR